jgi:hypothetical protein
MSDRKERKEVVVINIFALVILPTQHKWLLWINLSPTISEPKNASTRLPHIKHGVPNFYKGLI